MYKISAFFSLLIFLFGFDNCQAQRDSIWQESPNFNERRDKQTGCVVNNPSILVLHYTAVDLEKTIDIFKKKDSVSAHYTISQEGTVYQHVLEKNRAWHAGVASWAGISDVNSYSIGIEHINLGYKWEPNQPNGIIVNGGLEEWYPFQDLQIEKTIFLCKDLLQEYDIKPWNIVGHSDVSVGRKSDPGALYPWEKLFQAGVGAYQDFTAVYDSMITPDIHTPSISWMQKNLKEWGYSQIPQTGSFDELTQQHLRAFHLHFRQHDISSELD